MKQPFDVDKTMKRVNSIPVGKWKELWPLLEQHQRDATLSLIIFVNSTVALTSLLNEQLVDVNHSIQWTPSLENNGTLVYYAASVNNFEVVKLLVARDPPADVNLLEQFGDGDTDRFSLQNSQLGRPSHAALAQPEIEMFSYLHMHGAQVEPQTTDFMRHVIVALKLDTFTISERFLLETTQLQVAALMQRLARNVRGDTSNILIGLVTIVHPEVQIPVGILHSVLSVANPRVIEHTMRQFKIDPDGYVLDVSGTTTHHPVILWLVWKGYYRVVQWFLETYHDVIDINRGDDIGFNALQAAHRKVRPDLVALLEKYNAKLPA